MDDTITIELTYPQLKHLQKGLISYEALCSRSGGMGEVEVLHNEISEKLMESEEGFAIEDEGED